MSQIVQFQTRGQVRRRSAPHLSHPKPQKKERKTTAPSEHDGKSVSVSKGWNTVSLATRMIKKRTFVFVQFALIVKQRATKQSSSDTLTSFVNFSGPRRHVSPTRCQRACSRVHIIGRYIIKQKPDSISQEKPIFLVELNRTIDCQIRGTRGNDFRIARNEKRVHLATEASTVHTLPLASISKRTHHPSFCRRNCHPHCGALCSRSCRRTRCSQEPTIDAPGR